MADVLLKDVFKVYSNGFEAVHGVNLNVADGEFMVLVGPSGCGKSTTLRMIAGLEEISGGEILIGGARVNDEPPKDRNIAMVFQNYALYPHMTAYENMAFGLKLKKIPGDEIHGRVQEAAEILGITDLLGRKPKQLSGGQRQRVAVGRAIVRQPKVFLFDEPLSNLDAKLRVQMRVEIARLHRKLGTTMIYVTHDQVEALTLGDRICILEGGHIRQVDTPLNLYESPVNRFVAQFIGSPAMNVAGAEVESEGASLFLRTSYMRLRLHEAEARALKGRGMSRILFGIRPENIRPENDVSGEGDNRVSAEVSLCEQMGNETIIYFTVDEDRFIARADPAVPLKPGERCSFCFDGSKIYLFDPKSGENLLLD